MWHNLHEELDQWGEHGLTATFWWRDDDAVNATCKLDRLIHESLDAGLLLAVIPKRADSSLTDEVAKHQHIVVAQHGYQHVNHAPRGQGMGAWELGMHRGQQAVMGDLAAGKEVLCSLFNEQFIPVVVPPWNRIDTSLYQHLVEAGYWGVSAFGMTDRDQSIKGLTQLNCHCDPIKWKGGAQFTGTEKSISMLCEHLQARRTGLVRTDEPTGFLTHHLDMDEQSWSFTSQLNQLVLEHPAAKWCDPKSLFKTLK